MNNSAFSKAASIPMLRTLGIHLQESGDNYAVMTVTVSPEHANYYGGTHGGLLATLADTACFFPLPLIPSGASVTTMNLSLNYLRPASIGDELTARAELLRLGRRTANLSVTIENSQGQLLVQGSATLLKLHYEQEQSSQTIS